MSNEQRAGEGFPYFTKANIATPNDVAAHPDQELDTSESESHYGDVEDEDPKPGRLHNKSKRERLRDWTSKTKAKTKAALSLDVADRSIDEEEDEQMKEAISNLQHDPAFNPSDPVGPDDPHSPGKSLPTKVQAAVGIVRHPRRSIKKKSKKTAAGAISSVHQPHQSRGADLQFLEAHDDLSRAESSRSSRYATSEGEADDVIVAECRDKVEDLIAQRESLLVAWATKHIHRVRVTPKRWYKRPDRKTYVEKNENGEAVRFMWQRWLGNMLIYFVQDVGAQYIDDFNNLPFDIDILKQHIERVVVSSEPWQRFIMDIRYVYRWENPVTTLKWLVLYCVLLHTQHIMAFLWIYIIYIVIKNRFFPNTAETIRDSIQRSRSRADTAYQLGELIDKHGKEHWLDPVIDELGPQLQLQVGDLANMLEIFQNFYSWASPIKTIHSLFFFSSFLMISMFGSMEFCMKIFWFLAGFCFFIQWPIASRYPKYRYLVSPFKWMLWDVPTHAEWSFMYLRRQAQLSRERMIARRVEEAHWKEAANPPLRTYTGQLNIPKINTNGEDDSMSDYSSTSSSSSTSFHSVSSSSRIVPSASILTFHAQYSNIRGNLVIQPSGVRFVRSRSSLFHPNPRKLPNTHSDVPTNDPVLRDSSSFSSNEVFNIDFPTLIEMRKAGGDAPTLTRLITSKQSAVEELIFVVNDGREYKLNRVLEREKAFNCVLGFSGLRWQALQPGGEEGRRTRNSES